MKLTKKRERDKSRYCVLLKVLRLKTY